VYYAFDMDGRSLSPQLGCIDCPVPGPDPNQLPFVTQKVPLRNSYFDLPGQYGFMLIVLPPSYGKGFGDPTPDGRGYQQRPYMGWAGVQFDYGGTRRVRRGSRSPTRSASRIKCSPASG